MSSPAYELEAMMLINPLVVIASPAGGTLTECLGLVRATNLLEGAPPATLALRR